MGYTNSGLATYTKLSPNHSGTRKHAIDTISPHTMAGNLSVQTCGELFANPARKASSNYGIDSNGNIALYVEEKNRSWCTSNEANDQRAITIEVASINTTDYRPSDAAYAALINLMVDICRRNDMPKLLWEGNKNLIGNVARQNITTHRWFAPKGCPGNWMYDNMAKIVADVNAKLAAGTKVEAAAPETGNEGAGTVTNIEVTMWNFLDSMGLNDYAKAGIMGNIFAESGLIPNNLQNSFESKLKHTDASYTKAVDNGTYINFVRDGAGYGLCQWTYWSRKEGLLNYAKSTNRSIADVNMQLEYFRKEMTTNFKGLYDLLKVAKSVQEASDLVLIKFENPGGYGDNMPASYRNTRGGYSQTFYNKYAKATPAPAAPAAGTPSAPAAALSKNVPYTVRVTCSSLRIRAGAGTNFKQVGSITNRGVYTIVEEKTGQGANMWGKLKSGAGYIAVDPQYVTKL